ncbi:MAG: DUF1385 domain-containing protein [Armatimonadota bacterium]|nr:DUF1385 domain-containing protein [Armatimonadota bacterium]MCX7777148.1 DUF1385 domain-containing protein [Armatimonadota bacterium]MDW8025195.1 DUF1385 domain-containing protein [Armatimonadota bacterium]
MPNVGDIATMPHILSPDDPIGKAAELLRRSTHDALPVVDSGCVIGLVLENDVFMAAHRADTITHMDDPMTMRVREVMRTHIPAISANASIKDAAAYFAMTDLPTLPVIDGNGKLRGLVSRSDIASALCAALRPSRVAGMSTPLGVYLTCGTHRSGVGDLGLLLTGATIGALLILSQILLKFALHIIDIAASSNLLSIYLDANWLPVSAKFPISVGALGLILQILLFFTMMRFLPLSGWHGAEHKVVHAIERGEMLTLERVMSMPRVHPRCGTNLVVVFLLLLSIYVARPNVLVMILLIAIVLLTWRRLGMFLQAVFTTKDPTKRQLENALRAGKELVARYYHQPSLHLHFFKVLWNTGLIQALSGFAIVQGLWFLISLIIDLATQLHP